eukprot:scaffold54368_cov79-Phaeocystis_antarctica.AAC.1
MSMLQWNTAWYGTAACKDGCARRSGLQRWLGAQKACAPRAATAATGARGFFRRTGDIFGPMERRGGQPPP